MHDWHPVGRLALAGLCLLVVVLRDC